MTPSFTDPSTSQRYEYSHVEWIAYVVIEYGGVMGAARQTYPVAMHLQDKWRDAFQLAEQKAGQEHSMWKPLVQLLADVNARKFQTLDEFYDAFKLVKYPKRGKAKRDEQRRKARRDAVKAATGEAFISNDKLFHHIYRLASQSVHQGTAPAELSALLDELVAAHHDKPLTEEQRQGLTQRLTERITHLQQQITPVEVQLIHMIPKASNQTERNVLGNALVLYALIRTECAVGERTPPRTMQQWAELLPCSKNVVPAAIDKLVDVEALEVLEAPISRIPKGSKATRQAGVWTRLR